MPILSSLLVTLFGGLAGFFAKFVGVRVAAVAAALTAFSTLTIATYGALAAAAATINVTFPSILMTGVWMFVPDNTGLCLTAIIACDTACALYRWNAGAIDLAAKTS
jgi:hypothetical protein